MEDNSISLNATKILNKTFKPNGNGYDPDEVDEFLDKIIMDYRAFEKYYLESKKYIVELETNWRKEKEKISKYDTEVISPTTRRVKAVTEHIPMCCPMERYPLVTAR